MSITRRNFVTGAAMASAALTSASIALADDVKTFADTIAWDAQYDVVVIGFGFAGMTTAMTAADEGAGVLVVEKCPEGIAGGNSRVCGQGYAYAHGDEEGAIKYYKALAANRDVPDDYIEVLGRGVAHTADILETFDFPREEFWDLPAGMVVCPEYPEFEGGEQICQAYVHMGSSDAYLYQGLKDRIASKYAGKIDVWYESPAFELIQDPLSKTIVGVKVTRKGATRTVRALNGVVLCCGGFENDKEMVQHYLGVVNYCPMGTLDCNTGDGIKMAAKVGARMWHMNAYESAFAMLGCSYYFPEGTVAALPLNPSNATAMDTGATVMVGTWGKRFGDESFWPRHGHMPTGNGIWENPEYPEKIWVIWDKTQMDAINEAGVLNEDYRDTIVEYASIADIAAGTGMHEDVLAKTIADFNEYATTGDDKEFGRAAEAMRAFDGAAYFVMPMKPLVLNTQGGPERNVNAEVLGITGEPIPNLYSVGELGCSTACMYQSGSNTAECYIFGQIAGRNAAVAKDALPAWPLPEYVESNPALVGAETDLVAE